ncbi:MULTISPECIES: tryptophan synthase subunit alpha [Streptomyces]|uniref:Tryptophan synthase alpha chain n=1 Tax=Streptomyces chilikensis TaxID=1194079 RepID=A0ABV3EKG4_9ACTN|nr:MULTISPECIES: tryptophan synthase subunit alpha [Streptomyces]MDH6225214.1 tryptophan synthase alpha chain [Streptomyces sp. MJP52]
MKRLEQTFTDNRVKEETTLVAYITSGYPSLGETVGLIRAAVDAGADVIELGVPFSDPLGDGPVIQATGQAALDTGTTTAATIDVVAEARAAGVEAPIVLMGYCNPFLRYGLTQLYDDARTAGADGFVVPDLPVGEGGPWLERARAADLGQSFFAAPGSSPERIAAASAASRGFLYVLAANGVTGVRDELDPGIDAYLERVRSAGDTPMAVGFGISRPEHVKALHGRTDGVIVGSALLRAVGEARDAAGRRRAVTELVSSLKAATR